MLIFFLAMGSPPSVCIEQNFILASSCVVWRFSWDLFCKHFYWTQPRLLLEALLSYQNRPAKIQHRLLIRVLIQITFIDPKTFPVHKFPEHSQIPPKFQVSLPAVSFSVPSPCHLILPYLGMWSLLSPSLPIKSILFLLSREIQACPVNHFSIPNLLILWIVLWLLFP